MHRYSVSYIDQCSMKLVLFLAIINSSSDWYRNIVIYKDLCIAPLRASTRRNNERENKIKREGYEASWTEDFIHTNLFHSAETSRLGELARDIIVYLKESTPKQHKMTSQEHYGYLKQELSAAFFGCGVACHSSTASSYIQKLNKKWYEREMKQRNASQSTLP